MKLDSLDMRILELLQDSSMLSTKLSKIAKVAGTTNATVYRRIEAMKKVGIIEGHTTKIDTGLISKNVKAMIYIRLRKDSPKEERLSISEKIVDLYNVESAFVPIGKWNFLVKVTCSDLDSLNRFVQEDLGKIPVEELRIELISKVLKDGHTVLVKKDEQ